MDQVFDVAIIGGGINGCGCAADAALRGLSVVLFEKDDLASKTSSSSTKLIHGGLRYLEYYEFSLVKKALEERQVLLNLAPHLVQPQSFVLPYQKHMRPTWLLRIGLFFYDHLSRKNRLPKSQFVHRGPKNSYFTPLIDQLKEGFVFYDASTDDARLTISIAKQAKENGASIRPHSTVIKTEIKNGLWQLTIQNKAGIQSLVVAKTLINAAGPWVDSIARITKIQAPQKMALIKGSHIIVPKIYEGNQAYFLQHPDNRIVFVIPYHGFSMVGTTDVLFTGSLDEVHISDEEIDYLTNLVNSYFKIKINKKDIVYTWSGVRPLLADEDRDYKSLSRDYSFSFTTEPAPIITIYGGKITTYRQLAEEVVNQLEVIFPSLSESQTQYKPLPGAVFNNLDFAAYVRFAEAKYSWLDQELLKRYLFSYGSCLESFLSHCKSVNDMGIHFGASLYQVEVDYLIKEEWATDCEDILNRRTKLILAMDENSQHGLAAYLNTITSHPAQAEPLSH